jgi:hypothetical protein
MNSKRNLIYLKTLILSSQNNYLYNIRMNKSLIYFFIFVTFNSHPQRLFTMSNTDICASLQGNEMYDNITIHNMGRKICGLYYSLILMRIS